MKSICRGCNQQNTPVTSIFIPNTMNLFRKCTSLNIYNDDGLPAFICISCNDRCKQWLEFKKMCHQNDKLFRQNQYNSINISLRPPSIIPNENIKIELQLKQEFSSVTQVGSSSSDNNDDFHDNCGNDIVCDTNEPIITIKNDDNNSNTKNIKNIISKKIKKSKPSSGKKEKYSIPKTKSFQCEKCLKFINSRSALIRHFKRHGQRQFVCSYCAMQFHTIWCLNQHHRVHTGEKPFKCNLCSSAFKRSSNLSVHRRKHTLEKPYKCDKCTNTYFTNQQLKFHTIATHSAEQQPFACDFCKSRYKCEAILKRHKRVVHGCN